MPIGGLLDIGSVKCMLENSTKKVAGDLLRKRNKKIFTCVNIDPKVFLEKFLRAGWPIFDIIKYPLNPPKHDISRN